MQYSWLRICLANTENRVLGFEYQYINSYNVHTDIKIMVFSHYEIPGNNEDNKNRRQFNTFSHFSRKEAKFPPKNKT